MTIYNSKDEAPKVEAERQNEALSGVALPLALHRWTPAPRHGCQPARSERH